MQLIFKGEKMMLRNLFLSTSLLLLAPLHHSLSWGQNPAIPVGSPSESSRLVAQMPPFPPRVEMGPGEAPEPPWAKEINLSVEQRQRIQAIHTQNKQDIDELRTKLVEAHAQMRTLMESEASLDQLKQQHQIRQALHQEIEGKHFTAILAERQVLTPEQRAQIAQLMQRCRPPLP